MQTRRERWLLGVAVAAALTTGTVITLRDRPQPRIRAEIEDTPPEHTPVTRHCPPGPGEPSNRTVRIPDVLVTPRPGGPHLRDWASPSTPRDPRRAVAELEYAAPDLTACYHWARQAAPWLAGEVPGRLELDEWGRVSRATFTPTTDPSATAIGHCFEDVLHGYDLSGGETPTGPRTATLPLTVHLRPYDFERAHDVARPHRTAADAPESSVCDRRPAELPHDVLAAQTIEVHDVDPAPPVVPGHAFLWHSIEDEVHRRLTYNAGAFSDCYLAAPIAAHGGPAVRRFVLSFDRTGVVHAARAAAAADDALTACLESALADVWIPPVGIPFAADVRLVLDGAWPRSAARPALASVAAVERLAEAALADGDGQRAARHFAALLSARPEHEHACAWHVGRLAAALGAAPWGDARTTAAFGALTAWSETHPDDPSLADCMVRAAPVIQAWLAEDRDGSRTAEAIARLPALPNRRALRYALAARLAGQRADEARPLAEDPPCRATELYLTLAAEECGDPALPCAPAWHAVSAATACRRAEPIRHVCHGFPEPEALSARAERLAAARRVLVAHTPDSLERDRVLLDWAVELADHHGRLDEARPLVATVRAHDRPALRERATRLQQNLDSAVDHLHR